MEGEALLSLHDPSGREVLSTTLVPEISGSTITLRPEPVALSPMHTSVSNSAAPTDAIPWRAEITLPFFAPT